MKSFGLWLMSVTLLSVTLGCSEKKEEPAPPADPPANGAEADPATP